MATGAATWVGRTSDDQQAIGLEHRVPWIHVHGERPLTPQNEVRSGTLLSPTTQPLSTNYRDISASGQARQHNGNLYNNNSYHYSLRERRSDETLRDDQRSKVLLKAAAEGQTPRVKRLLVLRADIDFADRDDGYTGFHHAVLSGFEDVVAALLEAGADIKAQSTSHSAPIHLAALKRRSNITDLLLRYRAVIHAPGK